MSSPKLDYWSGANKARVRLFKKHEIVRFIGHDSGCYDRQDDWQPNMLSLPGPKAILERLLVNHDIIKAKNITAIQTYERMSAIHEGEPMLRALIRTRKNYLGGMRIWPYNFDSFANRYDLTGCEAPSNSIKAKWSLPPYKQFMNQMVRDPIVRFSILDLDLCGIFSKKNAGNIENMFKNRIVEPSGVMFITHQKGRDVRGGALFDILNGYLKNNHLIDFDSIPNITTEGWETYVARYVLIPLYYMCKAYEYGYALELTRLIEYRDTNTNSGLAVNMLQFFFKWLDTDYITDADTLTRTNLERVMTEEYEYLRWIA